MAVPKCKVSKARRNTRNSANFKSSTATLVECPECHALKQSHKVCLKCGYYDGKKVLETEKKSKKD